MAQKKHSIKSIISHIAVIIILLTMFVCFILIGLDVSYNNIYELDSSIHDYAVSIRSTPLTLFFKAITNFANPFVIGGISLALLFILKDKKRYTFALFLNLGLTALLNLSLKYIFARERPDLAQSLIMETGYSFPSGHAMFSVAFYGYLMFLLGKLNIKKSTAIPVTIGLNLIILGVCFSRIYLGVHYFSDIVGGILISSVYLIIFTYILNRHNFVYNEPSTDFKKHSFLGGFKYAFRGIASSIKDENNLLVQFSASMMVIMFAVFLKCTFVEWSVLIIMCFLVVGFEMLNTAIENVCDRITLEYDEQIKKAKDISAGAVLTMSICSVIVAGIIFIPKIPALFTFPF